MWIANRSDDVCVGVKCQSKVEIAGSPRNALRCSLAETALGGRALLLDGGFTAYQPMANSECPAARTRVRRRVRTSVVKRETTQTNS